MYTGGSERVASSLVNAFASMGQKVSLVVTYSDRGECHFPLDYRVELIFLSDIAGCKGRGIIAYFKRFLALRCFLKARRSGTVVSFFTNVNVASLIACVGLKIPVIVSERTHPPCLPLGKLWDCLRWITYPLAERVVVLTEKSLEWLTKNIPKARGFVIPNPVIYPLPNNEPTLLVAHHVQVNRKLILAVGRLDEGKQFDRLIDAFSRLAVRHTDWDLVILGDGAGRKDLERLIDRYGLKRRAQIPGRCGNVADWYERADLYVMSSRFEGFPNTLAEAMAHGCPCVSYDCDTGPRDIIRNEVDGLLVRPAGDVTALAGALDKLMDNEALRKDMRIRAIEVRERFSPERILGLWESIMPNNNETTRN